MRERGQGGTQLKTRIKMHSSNGFLGLIKKFCSCVFFVFLNKYFRQYFKCKLQHKVLFNKKERGVGGGWLLLLHLLLFLLL